MTAWVYTEGEPREYFSFGLVTKGQVIEAEAQPDFRFEEVEAE